jgi:hypothetical protein
MRQVHGRLSPQNVLLDERTPTSCGLLPPSPTRKQPPSPIADDDQPATPPLLVAYLSDACSHARSVDDEPAHGAVVCTAHHCRGGGLTACCGALGFVDPRLARHGVRADKLADAYAFGVLALVTLTGQPAVDLVPRCERMLTSPMQPETWRAPGVPDRGAGEWPERAACGLARIAASLVSEDTAARMPLPEAVRSLEAMLVAPAGGEEPAWASALQMLWFSDC